MPFETVLAAKLIDNIWTNLGVIAPANVVGIQGNASVFQNTTGLFQN